MTEPRVLFITDRDNPPSDDEIRTMLANTLPLLANLSEKNYTAIVLQHVGGLPQETTGRILGEKVGTVKSRTFRAKESLQKQMLANIHLSEADRQTLAAAARNKLHLSEKRLLVKHEPNPDLREVIAKAFGNLYAILKGDAIPYAVLMTLETLLIPAGMFRKRANPEQ